MPIDQRQKVSPPQNNDLNSLKDFASIIQQAFDDIFELAHSHPVRTTAPTANEGSVGDIQLAEIGGIGYIYVKLPTLGWKRVALS